MIKAKPNGRFTAYWYVNRRTKEKTFSTRKLAEDWLAKLRLQKERGDVYGQGTEVPIEGLIEQYCREVVKAKNSRKRDAAILTRWRPWLTSRRIKFVNQLTKGKVAEYETDRRADGVGQRTINIDIELIGAILNHAWKHDRIQYNPIARYPYKPDKKPFERFLTVEEINSILAAAPTQTEHDVIYTILTLGLRNEEACMLQYDDIKDNVIHIRPKAGWSPKWGRERFVPVDDPYLKGIFAPGTPRAYCFPNEHYGDGRPMNRDGLYRRVKKVIRKSGIIRPEEIHVHTLRHTHISYMVARVGIDREVTLRTIMESVGINDFQTLLRYSQAVRNLTKNLPDPQRMPWQKPRQTQDT